MPKNAQQDNGTEELIQLFNNQMFSSNSIDHDDLFRDLRAFKVSVEQAFPRLIQAMERKDLEYCEEFTYFEKATIWSVRDFLVYLLFKELDEDVCYYLLEALSCYPWTDAKHDSRDDFNQKLYAYADREQKDSLVFIARLIAFWHFIGEFDFDSFAEEATFTLEELVMIKPLLLRYLEYSLTYPRYAQVGTEAAVISRRYKVKEAIPLLTRAMQCLPKQKGSYDNLKDDYLYLRRESYYALGELGTEECLPPLLEALRIEPDWENFIELIYAIGMLKRREALPSIFLLRNEGIYGRSLNYFDENELNEATKYVLDKFNLYPSAVMYAAERIVFYYLKDFNEDERYSFANKFPYVGKENYEEMLKHLGNYLLIAGENVHQYEDSEDQYRNLAKALQYSHIPERFLEKTYFLAQFKDSKAKTYAKKIFPFFELEKKYRELDKEDF